MGGQSPRYIPSEALVEITARTVGARFLLLPTPELTARILGTLGRALSLFPISLHAFAFLSNHWHSLVSVPHGLALSRFIQHVHSTVAVAVKQLYGWDGKVFGRAAQTIVAPDSEERRLRYVLSQGAKEGLVASPFAWPGAHCARALAGLETLCGVWQDRSYEASIRRGGTRSPGREPLAREGATVYPIEFAPLPSWAHLTPEQRQTRVREMVREIEESAAQTHPHPLGAVGVLRQDPFAQPAKSKRARAPSIHTRDDEVRSLFLYARKEFRIEYKSASLDLQAQRPTEVPALCFPPRTPFQFEPGAIWARRRRGR